MWEKKKHLGPPIFWLKHLEGWSVVSMFIFTPSDFWTLWPLERHCRYIIPTVVLMDATYYTSVLLTTLAKSPVPKPTRQQNFQVAKLRIMVLGGIVESFFYPCGEKNFYNTCLCFVRHAWSSYVKLLVRWQIAQCQVSECMQIRDGKEECIYHIHCLFFVLPKVGDSILSS